MKGPTSFDGETFEAFLDGPAPDGSGRPLREVAFLVLDEAGAIDRAATESVLGLLAAGETGDGDEVRDPATGRVHAVYRASELPWALPLVDPLAPEHDLRDGRSVPYDVAVRPRLRDEAHQLLLFLRRERKIAAPRDRAAAEALVVAFASHDLDALLERFGGRGAYEKAARLGGLPIRRAGRATALGERIRAAFERLDALLRGRGTLAGFEAPGPEVATVSGFAHALARRLSVSALYAALGEAGAAAPFPSSRAEDYADAVAAASREKKLALETLLRHADALILAELADALSGAERPPEDAAAILRAVETLGRDGKLRAAATPLGARS